MTAQGIFNFLLIKDAKGWKRYASKTDTNNGAKIFWNLMISIMIKPARDSPTTSLVVLFQLGEEAFSGVVIRAIIKDLPNKNEELALFASSLIDFRIYGHTPGWIALNIPGKSAQ